ncbi:hypothetical protein B0H14DRAFT_3131661 [Mycena olivaceomarginata]|nr:hypothetical protein B0H14DRAFT_3131661 [Mycena olivaceomarginata]
MRFVSGEDLERALTCSICQDIMWKPVITPGCGHTFCRECLVNHFQWESATHATMHQGWNEIRPLPVHICPNCRGTVTEAPVINYAMQDLIELLYK